MKKWFNICLKVICLVVCFTLIFVLKLATVDGSSMENTYHDGDLVVVDRFNKSEITNEDVIVFWSANLNEYLIKRVIAKGSDRLVLDGTSVYLNEEKLDFDYIKEQDSVTDYGDRVSMSITPFTFYVMGDNRNYSTDSRSDIVGYVDEEDVVGKVVFNLTETTGISSGEFYLAVKILTILLALSIVVDVVYSEVLKPKLSKEKNLEN